MQANNFSPSVNIIRDQKKDFNYIPTENSKRVLKQIMDAYSSSGVHSFSLVGSYGTGKSAFILALEKQLKDNGNYFKLKKNIFKSTVRFKFINIVGEPSSFIDAFAKHIGLVGKFSAEDVLSEFKKYYKKRPKSCFVIIVDEFGKHLEYVSEQKTSSKEMYFLQQLAEFVNDADNNILFITTLHQNFDAYGTTLDTIQRQEWNKVRGRLKEIPFNEPVESLLALASDVIAEKFYHAKPNTFNKLYESLEKARLLPLRAEISEELANKLFPFDILAATVLTSSLQRYGQNERSLFSFLMTKDYLGINDFDFEKTTYYNLSSVYDYLQHNYFSFLFTKYNPHYTQWAAIRSAIERIQGVYNGRKMHDAIKLVKTIGLINIFSPEFSVLKKATLNSYAKHALGINDAKDIIDLLITNRIIRFAEYKNKFILFEGTDLDIDLALKTAEKKVEKPKDILTLLKKYFDFPIISAKRIQCEKGTPRFFEFQLTESPVEKVVMDKTDGVINLIFSEQHTIDEIAQHSKNNEDAILYGLYHNTTEILDNLWEIEKIKFVMNSVPDDMVALKELNNLISYQIDLLNNKVSDSFFSTETISWVYDGKKEEIKSFTDLNKWLTRIARDTYDFTPKFDNELINRDKTSSAITSARKRFFSALINCWDKEDLNLPQDKFPPEKMIYITLLKNTGMHHSAEGEFGLGAPEDKESGFLDLWYVSEKFLDSTKSRRRRVTDFMERLSTKPFKLKKGFIDFWIPTFLFINRDTYALFYEDRYIPFINEEIMELLVKAPKKIEIKAFNIKGAKLDLFHRYRRFIKQEKTEVSNASFIETIKPFIIFYKNLPEYTKKTKKLQPSTIQLREAISKSKDPEATFFEDFPRALGYRDLDINSSEETFKHYIETLQKSIDEIKTAFDNVLQRIEDQLFGSLVVDRCEFVDLVEELKQRYKTVKEFELTNNQKVFRNSLLHDFHDRISWLSGIVNALINKSVEQLSDEEIPLVLNRIEDAVIELNDLLVISKAQVDSPDDKIYRVTLASLSKDPIHETVPIYKKKQKKVSQLHSKLTAQLTGDKKTDVAALVQLLEEKLSK